MKCAVPSIPSPHVPELRISQIYPLAFHLSTCLLHVTQLHPDPEMQTAASESGHTLQQFMDSLNANSEIYHLLDTIKSNDVIFQSLSDEERYIVDVSLLELRLSSSMEKDDFERDRTQQLRGAIIHKEDEFYRLCHDIDAERVPIPEGIDSEIDTVPVDHQQFATAMKHWDSGSHRKAMFDAFYGHSDIRCQVLQTLREHRHELAQCIGFDSFAALKAQTSLFEGDIRGIESYLINLGASIRSQCIDEVEQLMAYNENGKGLKLWDLTFAKRMEFLENVHHRKERDALISDFHDRIGSHLSLDQCIQSLQRLMAMAFDLELDRCPFDDDGILKFELKQPLSGQVIGVLYLDLFERPNKV